MRGRGRESRGGGGRERENTHRALNMKNSWKSSRECLLRDREYRTREEEKREEQERQKSRHTRMKERESEYPPSSQQPEQDAKTRMEALDRKRRKSVFWINKGDWGLARGIMN